MGVIPGGGARPGAPGSGAPPGPWAGAPDVDGREGSHLLLGPGPAPAADPDLPVEDAQADSFDDEAPEVDAVADRGGPAELASAHSELDGGGDGISGVALAGGVVLTAVAALGLARFRAQRRSQLPRVERLDVG